MGESRRYEKCLTENADCSKLEFEFTLHDVLSQYKESPNLRGYIMSFIASALEAIDSGADLSRVLDIDCVSGDTLDLLGRIVVQPRPYIGIDEPWFSTEDNQPTDPLSAGFNEGRFWDGQSPLLGKELASDEIYRIFLKSKIARNVSKGTHNYLSFVVSYISCRDDIMIYGTNGTSSFPFVMNDGENKDTKGLSVGLWDLDDVTAQEPMTIVLKGLDYPIDTFLVSLFTQFDILPIPAGVKLIVDQS